MEHLGNQILMLSLPLARPTPEKEVLHRNVATKAMARVVATTARPAIQMLIGKITIHLVETAAKEVELTIQQQEHQALRSKLVKRMWRISGTTQASTRSRTSKCRNLIALNANNLTRKRLDKVSTANQVALKEVMEVRVAVKKAATVEPKAHLTQAKASVIPQFQV